MSQLGPCGRATPRSSVSGGGQPAAASSAGLPARTTEASFQTPPPAPEFVVLAARVTLVRVVPPSFQTPAPSPPAVLPLIVPLVRATEPLFQTPPPSVVERLPSRATFMSVTA